MLAEQRARAPLCEQVAPPLATVEAMSTPTEDEEMEVCVEEVSAKEDEAEDDEEISLQVRAPTSQPAD